MPLKGSYCIYLECLAYSIVVPFAKFCKIQDIFRAKYVLVHVWSNIGITINGMHNAGITLG